MHKHDGMEEKNRRARLGLQILIFLSQEGPAPYERLHEEFDPYNTGAVGLVLYDLIEAEWIRRIGSHRVEISDVGRSQLKQG